MVSAPSLKVLFLGTPQFAVPTLDAILAGAQSLFTVAYPEKMIDPILPALINPEATDPTKWADGKPVWPSLTGDREFA